MTSQESESRESQGIDQIIGAEHYAISRRTVDEILSQPIISEADIDILGQELAARRKEWLGDLSPEQQAEMIRDASYQILPDDELEARFAESKLTGRPLSIKYGIDPTASDVHLGHAAPMILLDRIRRMGHDVTFVIGDVTARIGDPSGRVASRPVLTTDQIATNMETYASQIKPIFDMSKVAVVHNSDWLEQYPLQKLLEITGKIPAAMLLQRTDFRKRIEQGTGITQAEILYPIVMALDSVELRSDIEVGGKDQFLNMQMCRTVMEVSGMRPEVTIATDLLEGTDGIGTKMSKSQGNYVALTQEPAQMYGQIMSIPDRLLAVYFSMLTELDKSEWQALEKHLGNDLNPSKVKQLLAGDIVQLFHGEEAAHSAKEAFLRQFSTKDYLGMVATTSLVIISGDSQTILTQAAALKGASNSEIRRIIAGGGSSFIDSKGKLVKIGSPDQLYPVPDDVLGLKIGKSVFALHHTKE